MTNNKQKPLQNRISTILTHITGLSNRYSRKHKKVVYTAITGYYDGLITPEYINKDWDYICFTDNPDLTSDFWQIRKMEELDD